MCARRCRMVSMGHELGNSKANGLGMAINLARAPISPISKLNFPMRTDTSWLRSPLLGFVKRVGNCPFHAQGHR